MWITVLSPRSFEVIKPISGSLRPLNVNFVADVIVVSLIFFAHNKSLTHMNTIRIYTIVSII